MAMKFSTFSSFSTKIIMYLQGEDCQVMHTSLSVTVICSLAIETLDIIGTLFFPTFHFAYSVLDVLIILLSIPNPDKQEGSVKVANRQHKT